MPVCSAKCLSRWMRALNRLPQYLHLNDLRWAWATCNFKLEILSNVLPHVEHILHDSFSWSITCSLNSTAVWKASGQSAHLCCGIVPQSVRTCLLNVTFLLNVMPARNRRIFIISDFNGLGDSRTLTAFFAFISLVRWHQMYPQSRLVDVLPITQMTLMIVHFGDVPFQIVGGYETLWTILASDRPLAIRTYLF